MITLDDIRQFLADELGIDTTDIEADTALFSSGVVDSFALITLMMHLEAIGGFRINPADVTLDNMDSLGRIVSFANRQIA